MAYEGTVTVGGPKQIRETAQLMITKIAVGPMSNNCYLLVDHNTGCTLLIDAANEADRLLEMCDGEIDQVLTTHCHGDHHVALQEVIEATGATTLASKADSEQIPVETEVFISDGDSIWVGDTELKAVLLHGHTAESIALIHSDDDGSTHVFTGDCLFPGGVGKTWSPDDFDALLTGVKTKLFDELPDDAWVYPGHGDDTTIGAERGSLDQWRTRGW